MKRRGDRVNRDWETPLQPQFSWEHVAIEVLMDIRHELRELNATMSCYRIPRMSDDINRIDRRLSVAGFGTTRKRK